MNVQTLRLRVYLVKQQIKSVWNKLQKDSMDQKRDKSRVMTEEEKLDEELRESFPASDPPGHFSKSAEDAKIH